MAPPSESRTLVLHALRLKGFAATDVVAGHAGLSHKEATRLLDDAAAQGLVVHRDGRITGWSLTPAGRALHTDLLAAELAATGTRSKLHDAYRGFLSVNAELLAVCTDWQMCASGESPVVNDHSDAVYDKGVVARLRDVHDRIEPVCADLAHALARYGSYGPRLEAALARVEAGDTEWFTRPVIDSYHTIWFELHEDLLCTLGIERSKEEAPA
ncbi:MAG: hypothetical protein QOK43_893 [Acidimicrobiaceae bacterium]|nr:hypothetical protein [Acidimicrobiaceae bacterium]